MRGVIEMLQHLEIWEYHHLCNQSHKSRPPFCKSRLCPSINLDLQQGGLKLWQGGLDLQEVGKMIKSGAKGGARANSHPGSWTMVNSMSKEHIFEKKIKVARHFI